MPTFAGRQVRLGVRGSGDCWASSLEAGDCWGSRLAGCLDVIDILLERFAVFTKMLGHLDEHQFNLE